MPDTRQLCTTCLELVPVGSPTCPKCGAALGGRWEGSFGDKLVRALEHPLSEVRMRAIIAAGWRGEPGMAGPLCDAALRNPVDVVEGLEVVASLGKLGKAARSALERLAREHPARAVRIAAGGNE